jgi:hypothetical protein
MATRMQQRRGTEAQWTSADPILAAGEIGFESDSGQFKIGDGVNHWSDLSYFKNLEDLGGSFDDYIPLTQRGSANGVATLDADGQVPVSQLENVLGSAPEALNTLNELAAALGDDADFAGNVTTILSGKAPKLSPALTGTPTAPTPTLTDSSTAIATTAFVKGQGYALDSDVNDSIDAIVSDVTGINTSIGEINDSIDSLNTSVNTSLPGDISALDGRVDTLETSSSSHGTAISTLEGEMDTAQSDVAGVISDLSTHELATTAVHGIDDTSALATKTYADTSSSNAAGSVATDLSSHESDTTSVHGITDTSKLVTTDASTQTLDGDLIVSGNLTIEGTTTTVNATDLVVTDPLIYIGEGNSANLVDLGLVSSFNDGTYQHSGIVRDSSAGTWKIFKGVTDEPTTTINFAQGSLDNLAIAGLTASSATVGGVAFSDKADKTAPITSKTGAYTIASADVNTVVEFNSGSGASFTIPADNAFWPVGQRLEVLQVSSGQLTIVGDSGVTVNGTPTTKTRTQWSGATIIKRGANMFVVVGDLASS